MGVHSRKSMINVEQSIAPVPYSPSQQAGDPGTSALEVLLALKAALEAGGAKVRLTGESPTVRRYLSSTPASTLATLAERENPKSARL